MIRTIIATLIIAISFLSIPAQAQQGEGSKRETKKAVAMSEKVYKKLTEAQELLSKLLAGRAEVYQTSELIEQGLFGPPPVSSAFLARVGNLVILPHKHESVWWYQKGKFEQPYYGHHGGLTPEEVEIPLLLYAFPE